MLIGYRNVKDQIIDAGLNPPELLTLMITWGCNLSCRHCLLDCLPVHQAVPIPDHIIMRIVTEFSQLGGNRLLLTGGEPLTHPDWLEILSFACGQQGYLEVGLQTNAAIMTEKDIHNLLSIHSDILMLHVSLDGAKATTHDRLRGKGSFDATMKALRLMARAGLGNRIQINFTEMCHNYDELPDAVYLTHSLGLNRLVSGTLVKGGRSLQWDWIVLPKPVQVRVLIEKYQQDETFSRIYDQVANIAAIEWFKGRAVAGDRVCSCIRTPFINARGEMYPCVMNLDKDLAVDRVHDRPLTEAIAEALPRWTELSKISRQRSAALKDCMDCLGREHCAGGCIGRAYASTGSVMSVEDRCMLRREVYYYERTA